MSYVLYGFDWDNLFRIIRNNFFEFEFAFTYIDERFAGLRVKQSGAEFNQNAINL
jgi:hypothetical protein